MNFDFNRFVYALVTSTTYGNWLPGDERGFIDGSEQNIYDTPYRKDEPGLKRYATGLLKGETVFLDQKQAETILAQWQKEMLKLDWHLFVVAIMSNHFHLLVAAPRDTDKAALLNRFKSRASFALNKHNLVDDFRFGPIQLRRTGAARKNQLRQEPGESPCSLGKPRPLLINSP